MVCAVIARSMIPMYFICLRQMIILLLSKKQCDRSKEISEEFPVFFHKLYFPLSVLLSGTLYGSVFKTMGTLGMHAGLVGFGEHYNSQFVNQTMSCVVFE